jgi:pimeloyl-ACP methyl ester carboxylesterase
MIEAYRMRGTRHAMMVFVRRQYTIDGLALMDGTYEGIEVPVLQIHGAKDEQIPLWAAKKVQDRLSAARLHVIEGASHDITVLNAEDVAEAISSFINETETCRSC